MNDKKKIRNEMKELLATLPQSIYESYSNQIANKLYQESDWKTASVIGITISRFPEVDTYPIIQMAWEQGKQVAVPKCNPKEKKLTFRTIKNFTQLETVYYGLLEPIEEQTDAINPDEINLLITPGLAFTREGFRLGFGGGYYDRFLMNYRGESLSLAFPEQIVAKIPMEAFDVPVSKIILPEEVIIHV